MRNYIFQYCRISTNSWNESFKIKLNFNFIGSTFKINTMNLTFIAIKFAMISIPMQWIYGRCDVAAGIFAKCERRHGSVSSPYIIIFSMHIILLLTVCRHTIWTILWFFVHKKNPPPAMRSVFQCVYFMPTRLLLPAHSARLLLQVRKGRLWYDKLLLGPFTNPLFIGGRMSRAGLR